MKTIVKRLFFIFLALFMVISFSQSASALVGSESSANGTGGITVYPYAKGTKYVGPLTIYYVFDQASGNYNMYFFLRLKKGSDAIGFSGHTDSPVSLSDTPAQQAVIEDFVKNSVIPNLYPDSSPPPLFLLKSVDNLVSDNALLYPGCCGNGMVFTIMDVVIAVQD